MKYSSRTGFFSLIIILFLGHGLKASNVQIEWPLFVLAGIDHEIKISHDTNTHIVVRVNDILVLATGNTTSSNTLINISEYSDIEIYENEELLVKKSYRPIPLWWSILPPLLAIVLALVFREVILSLFFGVYLGALIPAFYMDGFSGIFTSFLKIIDHYILNALFDKDHLSVIIFSMLIGATVSLISKNGGMVGIVNRLSKYAKSRRSGQFVTWLLGILIFFDDYANTLIVGNTMRPITDKLKISREKLSYIVDSTAAPIAAIAFVTTWIGAELGYIEDGIQNIDGVNTSAYQIFLSSLQYSFYPIFTLIFIAMLIWMKRDFGPMIKAERASATGATDDQLINVTDYEMKDFEPEERIAKRSFNALLPVLTIIGVTISALMYTGWDQHIWSASYLSFIQKLSHTIGQADPYTSLLWSSLSGLAVAVVLSLGQRILSIEETVGSIMKGFKTMLTAMIILVLAWSLSAVTGDLHTADFLTISISGSISPFAIPLVTFILAALVSFSTGSSWGTMAILYPMMLPLAWTICEANGFELEQSLSIFYNVVSCVLAGSVLGDHCSPISDTTILSSLASSCNHIEHVRTQLPYALTVGVIAILFGTIPASYGMPFYLSFGLGIIAMYFVIRKLGKEI